MTENSQAWRAYFAENAVDLPEFPWEDRRRLTIGERAAIAHSIQQFQLGEGSEGAGFVLRGEEYARNSGDIWFVPALRLFIGEEQRHSAWLGRFMDREGIPRLRGHWVDDMFRCLRKLAGLEMCVTVLVTAECIAVPYYRALHDATASRLLRAICRRILREEAAHIDYQATTLAILNHRPRPWQISLRYAAHMAFLTVTTAVVWREHLPVFRAAKYTWLRLWTEAVLELSRMEWSRPCILPSGDCQEV